MKKSLLALVLGSALVLTACDQAQKTAEKAQAAATEMKQTATEKATENRRKPSNESHQIRLSF